MHNRRNSLTHYRKDKHITQICGTDKEHSYWVSGGSDMNVEKQKNKFIKVKTGTVGLKYVL